jgi:phospholipase C
VEPRRAQILTDIQSCSLPQVSWVVPNGDASDHPGFQNNETYSTENEKGPAWVASIVNAVGNSWAQSTVNGQNHQCDYWGGHTTGSKNQPTTVLIVWDDWGGWWDHVDPASAGAQNLPVQDGDPLCSAWGCGNTYGFRVPFMVVSAFMASGIVETLRPRAMSQETLGLLQATSSLPTFTISGAFSGSSRTISSAPVRLAPLML